MRERSLDLRSADVGRLDDGPGDLGVDQGGVGLRLAADAAGEHLAGLRVLARLLIAVEDRPPRVGDRLDQLGAVVTDSALNKGIDAKTPRPPR